MHKKLQKGKKTAHRLQHLGICEVHVQPQKYKCPEMGEKENTQKHSHRCPAQKNRRRRCGFGCQKQKVFIFSDTPPRSGRCPQSLIFFWGFQSFLFFGNPSASSRISKCFWLRNHPPSDFNAKDIFCFASLNIRSPPLPHISHTQKIMNWSGNKIPRNRKLGERVDWWGLRKSRIQFYSKLPCVGKRRIWGGF